MTSDMMLTERLLAYNTSPSPSRQVLRSRHLHLAPTEVGTYSRKHKPRAQSTGHPSERIGPNDQSRCLKSGPDPHDICRCGSHLGYGHQAM